MITEPKQNTWLSTYVLVTLRALIQHYEINIADDELNRVIDERSCVLYHILRIPLLAILNGITLEQTKDYHDYAHKLLIDYLLSDASIQTESNSGEDIRESLEHEREALIEHSNAVEELTTSRSQFINDTQEVFIDYIKEHNHELLQDPTPEFIESLKTFEQQILQINTNVRNFKVTFVGIIIKLNQLLSSLPNYKFDPQQLEINLENLLFDDKTPPM